MVACRRPTSLLVLMLALTSLVAAACGGGGGSAAKTNAAAVTATFPSAHCVTDARKMTVRGTTADPKRIRSIEVDGVPASSKDQFANWTARVGISDRTTKLSIVPFDSTGAQLPPVDLIIDVETVPSSIERVALDPKRQQALVSTGRSQPPGAIALDLATGRWIEVSGPNRGSGPTIEAYDGFAIDAAKDVAYGFTRFPLRVVQIDLATGNREIVSDESSSGPEVRFPRDIDLDAAHGRVLLAGAQEDAIVAVDLSDGTRSFLSDATHGAGPEFEGPSALVVVTAQGRVLVVDEQIHALVSVDLATGDRSIVSDANRGAGPAVEFPRSVSFDPASGDALYVDVRTDAMLRVDLITGDRSVVTDGSRGGAPIEVLGGISACFDPSGRALLVDRLATRIFAVDLASGVREDLGRVHVGEATPMGRVSALALDPARGHVFITKGGAAPSLIEVDPATGRRTVVSSAGRGSGPLHTFANALAISPALRKAYVVDSSEVFAVDLATGNRSLLTGHGVGTGPELDFYFAITIDEERGAALVAGGIGDEAALQSVDLVTGERTEVSGPTRGSGETFAIPQAIALDADGVTAYVADRSDGGTLLRVDRVSGDREVISSGAIGGGPLFELVITGLSLDPDGRHAFVTDFEVGIFKVDLVTGDREVVSGRDVGLGPPLDSDGCLDAARGRFFARPANGVSVLSIDLESGDRVMISY